MLSSLKPENKITKEGSANLLSLLWLSWEEGRGVGANFNDKKQGSSFLILGLGVNATVIIKILKSINTFKNLFTEIFGNSYILFATHRYIQYVTVSMLKKIKSLKCY